MFEKLKSEIKEKKAKVRTFVSEHGLFIAGVGAVAGVISGAAIKTIIDDAINGDVHCNWVATFNNDETGDTIHVLNSSPSVKEMKKHKLNYSSYIIPEDDYKAFIEHTNKQKYHD